MIRYLVVALGLFLWVFTLAHDRPLFLDEANLARNLYDRSFAGLFSPLDHEQYAPPLYLLFAKALAELFGYREWVLRLPAFLGGLLGIVALIGAGRALKLGEWTALPLALLFVNPTVLRYVTEFKPYGLDLGLAAAILWAQLRWPKGATGWWLVAGVVLPWLSLPSVFVLAAVGLVRIHRDWRFAGVAAVWATSFGVLYWTVLRSAVGSDYLNTFHAAYFLPAPTNPEALRQISFQLYGILRLSYGFTVVSLVFGGFVLLYALFIPALRRYMWLLLPLAVALFASAFRFYTLIDRMLLFALPGVWLLTALAVRHGYYRLASAPQWVLLITVLVALGGSNIYRAVLYPYQYSDGRWLANLTRETDVPYVVDPSAAPVLDYYLRVKPELSEDQRLMPGVEDESGFKTGGRWLYDNAGDPGIRREIDKRMKWAAERGCRTSYEERSGSGSLRIKCPARNYDR